MFYDFCIRDALAAYGIIDWQGRVEVTVTSRGRAPSYWDPAEPVEFELGEIEALESTTAFPDGKVAYIYVSLDDTDLGKALDAAIRDELERVEVAEGNIQAAILEDGAACHDDHGDWLRDQKRDRALEGMT